MPYTYLTQAQFIAQLAARLQDPGNIYWSYNELVTYLNAALRAWNAHTGWYRQRVSIQLNAGQTFYDLSTATLNPVSAFNYGFTDIISTNQILYMLLENQISGGVWQGTDQFSLAAVQNALQNRINRFLGDSGCVVSRFTQGSGMGPTVNQAVLPQNVIDIRRVAWQTASGVTTSLFRADDWEWSSFNYGYMQNPQDPPQSYSTAVYAPTLIAVSPPPISPGNLDILAVLSGPTINLSSSTPTTITVPNEFIAGVQWGALAELLASDGQARDPARAAYCERRYEQYVELAKYMPSVLGGQVNGVGVLVGDISDLDTFSYNWQNVTGTPNFFGLSGRNILACSPTPNANMIATLDLVSNMVVPGNYLQVPQDILAVILDYAQRLASFKMGGMEWQITEHLENNFMYAAAEYNNRLRQMATFNDALRNTAQLSQNRVARMEQNSLGVLEGPYPVGQVQGGQVEQGVSGVSNG